MIGPITLSSSRKYFNELIRLSRLLLRDDNLVCLLPTLPLIDSDDDIIIDENTLVSAHKIKIAYSNSLLVYNKNSIGKNVKEELIYAIKNNKQIYFVFEPDDSVMNCYSSLGIDKKYVNIYKEYNHTFKDGVFKCDINQTLR